MKKIWFSGIILLFAATLLPAESAEKEILPFFPSQPNIFETKDFIVHMDVCPYIVDYNNDGLDDVILAGSRGTLVYLNTGSNLEPKFEHGKRIDFPDTPGFQDYACPCDFNKDGKIDFIVSSTNASFRLFLNTGKEQERTVYSPAKELKCRNEGKEEPITQGKEYQSPRVCVCDWNNDGKNDFLAGLSNGRILLYLNQGTNEDPVFSPAAKIQCEDNKDLVLGSEIVPVIIDWNNDGKKDLLTTTGEGLLIIWINSGTDTAPIFAYADINPVMVGGMPLKLGVKPGITLTELGGGKKNLLVAGENNLWLWKNTGADASLGYTKPIRMEARDLMGHIGRVSIADFNGDGLLDFCVGGSEDPLFVYLNEGSKTKPAFSTAKRIAVTGIVKVNPCDWNKNGKNDLAVNSDAGSGKTTLGVLLQRETGKTQGFKYISKPLPVLVNGTPLTTSLPTTAFAADFDGDMKTDIFTFDQNKIPVVYFNTGTDKEPQFTGEPKTVNAEGSIQPEIPLTFYDVNEDGKPDIVALIKGMPVILLNNSPTKQEVSFAAPVALVDQNNKSLPGNYSDIGLGDFNGDGVPDLAVFSQVNNGTVMLFTGSKTR